MMENKSLDELYDYLEKLNGFLRYAALYQGNINIENGMMTIDELEEELRNVKSEIAYRTSNSNLKFIKPNNSI